MKQVSLRILCALSLALAVRAALAQDVDAGRKKAEVCVACHGQNGNSTNAQFPILAGQNSRYLYFQLRDFKEGRRKNVMMDPIVANLSKQDMFDLAAYFAAQTPVSTQFRPDPEKAKKGKAKAEEVLCTMCHLGGFKGQNEIPRVAGQHYEYIVKQLHDFRAQRRTNDAGNMTSVAKNLTDADIDNLAQYIAGLQ